MNGLKNVRNRRDDSLSRVAWDQLEALLAIYYRGQGYQVEHVGTGGTRARFDGGIDLKLRKHDQYILVQCKHWNAKQVPHNDVHQLLGIMVNEGATGAILVTSGEFTAAAQQAASRQGHVQLIDGDALRGMIGPLPEPEPTLPGGRSFSIPRGVKGAAASIAGAVGGRLLSAAEDRIRGKRVHQSIVGFFAYKALASLIFGLLLLLVVVLLLQNAFGTLNRIGQAPPTAQPTAQLLAVPKTARTSVTSMPLADSAIEQTSSAGPSHTQSEADIRESRRKADEAIKVLEASTPEM